VRGSIGNEVMMGEEAGRKTLNKKGERESYPAPPSPPL